MAESVNQRKANLKYRKTSTKSINLMFFPTELPAYETIRDYASKHGGLNVWCKKTLIDAIAKEGN